MLLHPYWQKQTPNSYSHPLQNSNLTVQTDDRHTNRHQYLDLQKEALFSGNLRQRLEITMYLQ